MHVRWYGTDPPMYRFHSFFVRSRPTMVQAAVIQSSVRSDQVTLRTPVEADPGCAVHEALRVGDRHGTSLRELKLTTRFLAYGHQFQSPARSGVHVRWYGTPAPT